MQFALVEKITKTQVTAGGVRFLLNGREVGGDKWHPAIIMPATPELKAKQRELGRLFMAESALEKIGKYILSLRGDAAADVLEGLPSLLKIASGLEP